MIWAYITSHTVLIVSIMALIALVVLIVMVCVKPFSEAERLKVVSDFLAIILLFLCGIGVLIAGVSWFYPRQQRIPDYNLVLSVCPDSTGFDTERFSFYSDSLINVVNRHERILDEKYASFISEKEQTLRIESIVGILISIIVAVVGFFGYKSIKSIEKKAADIAKERVEHEVVDYLDKNLVGMIRKELKSSFFDYIDEKTANKVASQVKGEIKKQIINEVEEQIRKDVVGYFMIGDLKDNRNIEPDANNPFDQS